jgi:hypothetical protein
MTGSELSMPLVAVGSPTTDAAAFRMPKAQRWRRLSPLRIDPAGAGFGEGIADLRPRAQLARLGVEHTHPATVSSARCAKAWRRRCS